MGYKRTHLKIDILYGKCEISTSNSKSNLSISLDVDKMKKNKHHINGSQEDKIINI